MKNKTLTLSILLLLSLLIINTGCKSILPSEAKRTTMRWKTYEDAQKSFDQIILNVTTVSDLRKIGYNTTNTPNMRVLTYLDLIKIFMPNAGMTLEELHPQVKECIQSKDLCTAYELELEVTDKNRFGNPLWDIFGFRKNTKTTGWKFRSLILIKDGLVVYKLCSGQPELDVIEKKKNPLGPFQELDDLLGNTLKSSTKL